MKKYLQNFKFFVLALGLMLTASLVNAADRYVVAAGGNWNSTATWSTTENGAGGASIPVAGDAVFIPASRNLTVTTGSVSCASITFTIITGSTSGGTLTVNAGATLTVTGAIIKNNATQTTSTTTIAGAGILNCASFQLSGVVTAPSLAGDATLTLVSTITQFNITGNLSLFGEDDVNDEHNATFDLRSGTVTVGGSLILNEDAGTAVLFTLNSGGGGNPESGTLILSGATPFTVTGTPDFDPNGGTAKVEYSFAGAQTVLADTYNNLTLSGSGAKTLTGSTINATLSIQGTATTAGTTPTYGASAILEYKGSAAQTTTDVEFPATLNADLTIDNAAGVTLNAAKTLNGNLTLTAGALAAGTNLTMGAGGTPLISVDAGSMTGTLQGANDYDVEYTGVSKTTGPELSGTGLRDIDLNLTAVTDVVTLDQNRSPDGSVTLGVGTLDLLAFTLNRSAAGGTFDVTNESKLKIGGTNTFPSNYSTHSTSNTNATIEYAGTNQAVIDLNSGESYTILILSGSDVKTLAAGIQVDVQLSIQGTATLAGTSPTYSSAILEYNGSAAQNTSNVEFPAAVTVNVTINNAAGVTLNGAKTLSGNLTLTSGLLTTTATNLLTLAAGFGTSGASDNSFVNGPMAKTGTTAFTFPVGKSGAGLRTIAIGAPSGTGATFTAEFFRANPQTAVGNAKTAPITQISACEYWTLNRSAVTVGNGNATVTLSWAAASTCNGGGGGSYINDLASLRVARWTGATWEDRTNTGTTGNGNIGTITSNSVTTFSPFVLATTSNLNPLPVTFDDVKAFEKGTGVQIEWSNLTEKDVLNYEVERSANGRDFTAISQLASRSNLSDKQSYLSFDGSPLSGTNYYRIKVIEIDGKVIYSKVLKVDIGKNVKGITLYPNPVVGSDISIVFTAAKGQYTLRVVNNAGQQVFTKQIVHPGGSISQSVTLPSALKTGVYNLMISGDNYMENKKFIMQ